MGTANRVIKNTGFLYAKMGITMFISLYITRIVLNALGASDYGIFNVVGGAIAMLGFLHVAMSSATQRFMSYYEGKGDPEKQKYIFNVSSVLHFGIAIILAVVLIIAGFFFFSGILNIPDDRMLAAKVIYGSLILSTIFTVISVPYEAVLNAHENMLYYAIVGVIESLLKLAVALIITYYAGDKLILYGILMAAIPFISRTIMQIYCHKKYTECIIAPRHYFEKSLMKEMTSFAGWSFLGTASSMISQYGLGIVLNNFFGTVLNAAQGVANQISGQAGALGPQIRKALSPVIVKSVGTKDYKLTHKSVFVGTKIMLLVESLFFLPIFLETNFILKLWLKQVPEYASIFVVLLLLTNLIDTIYIFLPTVIEATGKIKTYQKIMSIISFMPIVLCTIAFSLGAPAYTLYLTTIISSILKLVINILFTKRLYNISQTQFYKSVLIVYVISISVSYLLTSYLISFLQNGITRLVVSIFVGDIIFVLLYFFIGFSKQERYQFIEKSNFFIHKFIYRNE